tara:strand:- start:107 stop:712 length:606 start_codon:yes stop_codon:yes gene_type:complete
MKFNKAAMFGLDARIALAIFGALSVISGAALYSAIQESKAVALLADLREVGKSWEQYYLDTGSPYLSEINANGVHLKIANFITSPSGLNTWKGPYVSYSKDNDYTLAYPPYDNMRVDLFSTDNPWGNATSPMSSLVGKCTAGSSCFLWVTAYFINNDSMLNKIDSMVDGGDGFDSGNFRVYTADVRGDYIYLNISPVINPN